MRLTGMKLNIFWSDTSHITNHISVSWYQFFWGRAKEEKSFTNLSLLNPGALARVSVPYFDWLALSMYIQVITWTVPGRFITDEENRERRCQGMVNTETFWLEISPCSGCKCGQLRYYSSLEINHCLRSGSYSTASLRTLFIRGFNVGVQIERPPPSEN